jgi:ribosomal protein L16 Arg81 hydroxylase
MKKESAMISAACELGELSDLLSPVTPETFTTEYWCRKPLFIKGCPEKLQSFFKGGFGREEFWQSVREGARKDIPGFHLFARKHAGLRPMGSGQFHVAIKPDQMEWFFASGAIISAIGVGDERVARFAAALKSQLHHPGEVKIAIKLSPEGAGWPPHIDEVSVINIQCEGRKRFLISSDPIAQWPRRQTDFATDGTPVYSSHQMDPWEKVDRDSLGSLTEVILEPGDVLFFPPGTVHATENLTESTLTIGLLFEHETPIGLMSRMFENNFSSNPDWHFPAIDCTRTKAGELPSEARDFFDARLKELRNLVNTMTPDSPELHRLWKELIADPGESVRGSLSR